MVISKRLWQGKEYLELMVDRWKHSKNFNSCLGNQIWIFQTFCQLARSSISTATPRCWALRSIQPTWTIEEKKSTRIMKNEFIEFMLGSVFFLLCSLFFFSARTVGHKCSSRRCRVFVRSAFISGNGRTHNTYFKSPIGETVDWPNGHLLIPIMDPCFLSVINVPVWLRLIHAVRYILLLPSAAHESWMLLYFDKVAKVCAPMHTRIENFKFSFNVFS